MDNKDDNFSDDTNNTNTDSGGGTVTTTPAIATNTGTQATGTLISADIDTPTMGLINGSSTAYSVNADEDGYIWFLTSTETAYGIYLSSPNADLYSTVGYTSNSQQVQTGASSVKNTTTGEYTTGFKSAVSAQGYVVYVSNYSGGDLANFDLIVQEAALGGQFASGPTVITSPQTPTWIGADSWSNTWFSFTSSGSSAIITITDLTMGVNVAVYDANDAEVAVMTTDGVEDDLTTRTVNLPSLTHLNVYKIQIKSLANSGVSVGQITIAPPVQ